MKHQEWIRTVKFTLFSISAGAIELGTFALLNELLRLPYWLSYVAALVLSVLWNFTLNAGSRSAPQLTFPRRCSRSPATTPCSHR